MSPSASRPESVPFLPILDERKGATVFRCDLCGARFTHGTLVCASCPLHAGCDIVKCPECGYQFPRTSKLVEWTKVLARRIRGRAR